LSIPNTNTLGVKEIGKLVIYTRIRNQFFTTGKISVSKFRNNYVIGHFINADLSLLNDFSTIKDHLDVVNNCLITLKQAIFIDNTNVYIKDTILLAPGNVKSLAAIGNLYGEDFRKINIDKQWYSKMDQFMNKEPLLFKKYAMRDSLITLRHAIFMEDLSFSLGGTSIPITLASLSRLYIHKKWNSIGYEGYQKDASYLISEADNLLTPKGLLHVGDLGFVLGYYIGNYKGGRNESFMYGIDDEQIWYDLTGAYLTAMSLLGDPDYNNLVRLDVTTLNGMSDEEILYSYIIIKTDFSFKDGVKYPSIPCFLDKTTTIYPLKGSAILTGSEYIVARNIGCVFQIKDIYNIPFKRVKKASKLSIENVHERYFKQLSCLPFRECVNELQCLRREHPKGHVLNQIYKSVANSLYGLTTKGISNKTKYDFRTKTSVRMSANELSNPLISSWITAYVRSVFGEILHNISLQGGVVVSVTTDGL